MASIYGIKGTQIFNGGKIMKKIKNTSKIKVLPMLPEEVKK